MIRDELWADSSGQEHRVDEVRNVKDADGQAHLAFVWMRDRQGGGRQKVMADALESWKRLAPDPLAGHRRALLDGRLLITFDAGVPCPLEPGERFQLQGCVVTVHKVTRKLIKGTGSVWVVAFNREDVEPVYLLRSAPPAHSDRPSELNLDADAIRKAGVESAYTSSPVAAIPTEPESVGPDWKDTRAPQRELERQQARTARQKQVAQEGQVDRLVARVRQVGTEQARAGVDVGPLLDDIYVRLAQAARQQADTD